VRDFLGSEPLQLVGHIDKLEMADEVKAAKVHSYCNLKVDTAPDANHVDLEEDIECFSVDELAGREQRNIKSVDAKLAFYMKKFDCCGESLLHFALEVFVHWNEAMFRFQYLLTDMDAYLSG
jgi:hypothetical protein